MNYLITRNPDVEIIYEKDSDLGRYIDMPKPKVKKISVTFELLPQMFLDKLTNMVKSGLSFGFFNHPDLKFFLDEISDKLLGQVVNSKNIKILLYENAKKMVLEITKILKARMFFLKLDCVKVRGNSFLGINCQLVEMIESKF